MDKTCYSYCSGKEFNSSTSTSYTLYSSTYEYLYVSHLFILNAIQYGSGGVMGFQGKDTVSVDST